MSRPIPRRWTTLALVAVLAAGGVVAALAPNTVLAQDPVQPDPRTFDGWRVVRYGEESVFRAEDGWEREQVARDAFSLSKRGRKYTVHGTFRAERLDELSSPPEPADIDAFEGWEVDQFGQILRYARLDGWEATHDPDGLVLRRRGQIVWYYGTFAVTQIDDVK